MAVIASYSDSFGVPERRFWYSKDSVQRLHASVCLLSLHTQKGFHKYISQRGTVVVL
jgi:hypothetical protein